MNPIKMKTSIILENLDLLTLIGPIPVLCYATEKDEEAGLVSKSPEIR
jgi:hypothetical protein